MNASLKSPAARETGQTYSEAWLGQELEFLWQDTSDSGKAYNIYLGRISRSPVVQSLVTRKYFMLPWSGIIDLAVKKGVDRL